MPQADLPSCAMLILILHYFHTTTFFWMFVEGLYLYILVVETFNRQNIKTHVYMLIGWGEYTPNRTLNSQIQLNLCRHNYACRFERASMLLARISYIACCDNQGCVNGSSPSVAYSHFHLYFKNPPTAGNMLKL